MKTPTEIREIIAANRWRPIEGFPKIAGTYLLKGEGFVWEDFWRETATGDAYWEDQGDIEPTHYMAMPTDELADIAEQLLAENERLKVELEKNHG